MKTHTKAERDDLKRFFPQFVDRKVRLKDGTKGVVVAYNRKNRQRPFVVITILGRVETSARIVAG